MNYVTAMCGLGLLMSFGQGLAVDVEGIAPTRLTIPLPGIVRCDQGTIEITVCPDRPQCEFGNDWEFPIQIKPGATLVKGGNTLLGIVVPTAPESGLVAVMRTGARYVRAEARSFAFEKGKSVNLAVTWGRKLELWANGLLLCSSILQEVPDERLWPAQMSIGRFSPFDPKGLRISSIARGAADLDADPATPFEADADTTLVVGPGMSDAHPTSSRWQRESACAIAKPVWIPDQQCRAPGDSASFPVMVANHGDQARVATLDLELAPLAGNASTVVHHDILIPPGTAAQIRRLELPPLGNDYWTVAWSIAGDGLPTLSGSSAIAIYPRSPGQADGSLSGFYSVHIPEEWDPRVFTRMGVRATRAWAQSTIFLWHRIEPTPGRFRFEAADEYVASCMANRVEPLAVLGYPSRWAALEPPEDHKRQHEYAHRPERWKPADKLAWARYVRALAERYQGRVRHWEIYNEVNFCPPAAPATFSGSVEDYLELQRIAYREIKAVDEGNQVLSSGFSTSVNKTMPLDALRGGLADACDIFNVHGYSGVDGSADWVDAWRRLRPDSPVWMTEQVWNRMANDRQRWWLTAALPLQYAAAGYRRFYNMGVRVVFFDPITFSPKRDQWVVAVLNDQLRPCDSFDALTAGDAGQFLDLRHRFRRIDGSFLTVIGSRRSAMRIGVSMEPVSAFDLFGRPLAWKRMNDLVVIDVPDLAYLVSNEPLNISMARPLGADPLYENGGFELIDGDVAIAGLDSGRPHGYTLHDTANDPHGSIHPSTEARSGSYAMELSSSGPGQVHLYQSVQLWEAGTYELSGWFRCTNGASEPFIYIRSAEGRSEAKLPKGGTGWQELRLSSTLAAGNRKPLLIGWGIRGAGRVLLDDIGFSAKKQKFDHVHCRAIDLGDSATVPRADWSSIRPDLGGDSLASLEGGDVVLGGLSFHIGDRLVVLGNTDGAGHPQRAVLDVNAPADSLSFLHTAIRVGAKSDEMLGRYIITYDDGSTSEHPLANQRNIADWYAPKADKAVPVAVSFLGHDQSTERNVYSDRWVNPEPAKRIRSLTVENTGRCILLVVGVTAERR